MSLINAFHLGDHTLVGADTDAVFPDGARGNVSKLMCLPHLGAVIAGRGSMAFLQKVHAEFSTISSFDLVAECAELMMLYALAMQSEIDVHKDCVKGAEMILSGYSEKYGKVVIHVFRCSDKGVDSEAHLDVSNAIIPGDLGVSLDGITASREGLVDLTRRQVMAIRENSPDSAAGGYLLVAEVRHSKVTVETVARL